MGFMWPALDESADRDRRYAFVVAGYLARQDDWTEIERQWTLRLERESDPQPMKYFTTTECKRLSGQFARFKDKDKYPKPLGRQAADKIKDDLQEIMKRNPAFGFCLGVGFKDYKAARGKSTRAKKILLPDPYEHMYTMLMIVIAGDLEDEFVQGIFPVRATVAYLCDEHDKSVNVKAVYDELKKQNPTCAQWMGSLSYMNNEDSPALQTGDLLAGVCKDAAVEMLTKTKPGHRRVIPDWFKPRVGAGVSFRFFDQETLQQLVDANLLKRGRPTIFSTQQLILAKDFILKGKQRKTYGTKKEKD